MRKGNFILFYFYFFFFRRWLIKLKVMRIFEWEKENEGFDEDGGKGWGGDAG